MKCAAKIHRDGGDATLIVRLDGRRGAAPLSLWAGDATRRDRRAPGRIRPRHAALRRPIDATEATVLGRIDCRPSAASAPFIRSSCRVASRPFRLGDRAAPKRRAGRPRSRRFPFWSRANRVAAPATQSRLARGPFPLSKAAVSLAPAVYAIADTYAPAPSCPRGRPPSATTKKRRVPGREETRGRRAANSPVRRPHLRRRRVVNFTLIFRLADGVVGLRQPIAYAYGLLRGPA